jgi:hypothetical protein
MKNTNWKTFAVGLVCGLILGFGAFLLFGQNIIGPGRFVLMNASSGNHSGIVFKMDTRTGQTWLLDGLSEIPVQKQSKSGRTGVSGE